VLVKIIRVLSVLWQNADDALFTREDGVAVRDFRKTWRNVCCAAGVPELIVHYLRKTAARDLRRAGVSENVVMAIGGWNTRSVLDRYSITSETDVADAVRKLQVDRRERSRYGHVQAQAEPKAETNVAPS
jgi:integrase